MIAPLVIHSVNTHDSLLLPYGVSNLVESAERTGLCLRGSTIVLDAGFDAEVNKKFIKWHGMIPVIKPNKRRITDPDTLQSLFDSFDYETYKKRFTIERTFAWQDTYRKLVTRYERLECTHTGFKYLAYSLMNLRVFVKENRRNSL